MRYACVFYADETKFDALSQRELEALQAETMAFDRKLEAEGRLVFALPLESTRASKSVRVRRRKAMVTDGPFAETKEQLLGFLLVEVADQDQAVAIAAASPLAPMGTVEVRPELVLPAAG